MPISSEHVGRTYPPTRPYEVTQAKIAEFATALGDGAEDGSEPVTAPPTFAAVIAAEAWEAMFTDPDLDLALRRIVHADQRFAFDAPLRAGDRVTATLTIDQVRARGGSEMISSTVRITRVADDGTSETGDPVAAVQATFLHSREEAPA